MELTLFDEFDSKKLIRLNDCSVYDCHYLKLIGITFVWTYKDEVKAIAHKRSNGEVIVYSTDSEFTESINQQIGKNVKRLGL